MKNLLQKTNQFTRSLLFSTFLISTATLWSGVCILSYPFPLRIRAKLVVGWTNLQIAALKFLCGIHYEIEGLENIPKDRTGVILSKHQSTWETFFLPQVFHCPAIILKRELLWVPFFGWGLAMIDPIAINRSEKASAMEQIIKKGKKCLEAGRWILVFPEGTRVPFGMVGKYRLGGARLAVDTGYPVIPVAHNAGRFWPRKQFLKIPGTVKVMIGPLIETKGKTAEQVLVEVKTWIENACHSEA